MTHTKERVISKVYVDVDNLYISNDKVSLPVLRAKISAIYAFAKSHKVSPSNIHWFGNAFTAGVIRTNRIRIPIEKLIITNIDKDTADHMIIHTIDTHITKHIIQAAYIVSNDISIANIAWTVLDVPIGFIQRAKFTRDGVLYTKAVNKIEIRHPADMLKVMKSYITYAQRYMPHMHKTLIA